MNFSTFTTHTQDFLLRLFVAKGSYTAPSYDNFICSHVGTHARLHN